MMVGVVRSLLLIFINVEQGNSVLNHKVESTYEGIPTKYYQSDGTIAMHNMTLRVETPKCTHSGVLLFFWLKRAFFLKSLNFNHFLF